MKLILDFFFFFFFFYFFFSFFRFQPGRGFFESFELLIVGCQGFFEGVLFVIHEDFFRRVRVRFLRHVPEQELRLGFRKPGFDGLTFEFLHEMSINP